MRRLTLFVGILAASMCLWCCSSPAADEATPAERVAESDFATVVANIQQILDATPAPANMADSLSYYMGFCEGMTYNDHLKSIPDDVRQGITPDDYLAGVYEVLASDTVSNSYAAGVRHGAEAARYLNILEHQGVKINRRILASTITTMLDNPALDSITKHQADSIAGMIIGRHIH